MDLAKGTVGPVRVGRMVKPQLLVSSIGDFNADLHRDASTQSLSHRMTDVYDLLARPPPAKRRITFSYFEDDHKVENQLDAILVLNDDRVLVRRADVYRFRDSDGNEYALPKNYEERRKLPSDHNPHWADVLVKLP